MTRAEINAYSPGLELDKLAATLIMKWKLVDADEIYKPDSEFFKQECCFVDFNNQISGPDVIVFRPSAWVMDAYALMPKMESLGLRERYQFELECIALESADNWQFGSKEARWRLCWLSAEQRTKAALLSLV